MTDNELNGNNGRVTTAQLYQAILQVNERMDVKIDALSRQIHEMTRVEPPRLVQQVNIIERDLERETRQRQYEDSCLQVGVEENRDEIVELKIQSTRGDRINAALAAAAGIISGLFGAGR